MTDIAPQQRATGRAATRPVPFERELDMHAPIAAIAGKMAAGLPRHRTGAAHVLFEVPAAAGIPDVLRVAFDTAETERREALGLAPVADLTELRVLVATSNGPVALTEVARSAQVTAAHVRRTVIPVLAAAGWLEPLTGRGDRAVVTPRARYRSLVASVVTVEAKRRDWRGALTQARRHQACADRVYVAIDAATPGPLLGFADELSRRGIGLVTVDAAALRATLVTRPAAGFPRVDERSLVGERAWSLVRVGRTTWDTFDVFGRDLTERVGRAVAG